MDSEIRKYFTKLARLFDGNEYVWEKNIIRTTHTIMNSEKCTVRVNYTTEDIEKALELNIIAIDHIDSKTEERYFKITDFGTRLYRKNNG